MRSKGEETFIEQKTRQLLVEWADFCLKNETLPHFEVVTPEEIQHWSRGGGTRGSHPILALTQELGIHKIYWDHAIEKGWLTKKTPRTLTAKGWEVAAAFLKR